LFTGSLDGTVKIWCYHSGLCVRTLTAFENTGVISLAYRGRILCVGGQSGELRVFDTAKGTVFTLPGHSDWVNCIRFVSDRTLLSCSDDGTIKVWDLDTRQCVSTLTGHTHHVQWIHLLDDLHTHPSLSPSIRASDSASATDSSQPAPLPFAISASLDNTLRIWDLSTGRCIETLFGHVEGIWSVALDALRIASSSNDGEVKVWDTTSRKCIHTLKVSDSSVNCLTLSDTRIVCGDNEGVVTIYDFRNNK
ncbi:ubiquitin-binding SDF ubiquitin ligase complex subunit met30, partial [Spiromyces aspiralis]